MARWIAVVVVLGLGAVAGVACTGADDTLPPDDGRIGCGGGCVGGGGSSCNSPSTKISCIEGATYVALLQICPPGSTPLEFLHCDSCQCGAAACSVNGAVHDQEQCNVPIPIAIEDVQGCHDAPDIVPDLFVQATVDTGDCSPMGEPKLKACQLPAEPCAFTDACVPGSLLSLVPLCILPKDNEDCPPGYDKEMVVQEGGTCGCACEAPSEECPSEVRLFSDNECSSDETTVAADGSCAPVLGLSVLGSVAAPEGPVCDAGTPSPSGGTQKTLCCVGTP